MILRSSRDVLFLPCASFATNSFSKIIIISTSVPQHRYQNTNRLQRNIDTKTSIGFNATSIPKHQSASTQHRYQNTNRLQRNIDTKTPIGFNATSIPKHQIGFNATSIPQHHIGVTVPSIHQHHIVSRAISILQHHISVNATSIPQHDIGVNGTFRYFSITFMKLFLRRNLIRISK